MNQNPIQLIKDFIHDYLHDNIDELKSFRLYDLKGDNKYGCPDRKFDSDDTNLMRAIYCALFADAWNGLSMVSLNEYVFRGDTMNTYNTLFGRPNPDSLHPGLDKFEPSEELKAKVEYFQNNICGTIGNMTVLPNIGQEYNDKYETINTYRGCHNIWHDFFDQFLVALQEVLEQKEDADYPLKKHIMLNKTAFMPYMDKKGVAKLSKILLWEDYLDDNGYPVISSKGYYYWRSYGMTREEYLQEADRYIDFASSIIEKRACSMVNELKSKIEMERASIEPVSIGQLVPDNFWIPSYQRGYRWTTQQVKDLLEDIEEFMEKGSSGIYCIQPLVVRKNGETWEVIDGQQRLTTINIMLSCLHLDKYTLQYETRDKSHHFLDHILEKTEEDACDNIDYYHIIQTRDYILNWIKEKDNSVFIESFKNVLLSKVKFIWYDTDTQDPIAVFTRLNIDKIPLTSAELIKALLLNRSNYGNNINYERLRLFQQELASQWDEIESKLQNDEFWLFFHDDGQVPETRIDYIFEMMCNQRLLGEPSEDIGTDQSYVFRYFYDYFHTHKYSYDTLQNVWIEVRKIYNTLNEWFTHLELYHYIGYLMARPKESTRQRGNQEAQQKLLYGYLCKWNEPGMTIGTFKQYLISQINNTLNECNDLNKEYENGHPKTQCRPLLLLHNIETVIQQGKVIQNGYNQEVFNKFPFNLYKKERWDVEHIDSNTSNELMSFDSQKEWLLTAYIIATEEQKEEIRKFCVELQDESDNYRKPHFDKLAESIFSNTNQEERLNAEEKNMIWNFTLLDEGTNRGYGNAIFPAKRRTIIGKEQGETYPTPTFNKEKGFEYHQAKKAKSVFIPPCTKQAFMKYYSPTSGTMVAWTKPDAEAYKQNMIRVLSGKFNIKA